MWLAWNIATAAGSGEAESRGRSFTFLQAAGFQWVNLKSLAQNILLFSLALTGPALRWSVLAGNRASYSRVKRFCLLASNLSTCGEPKMRPKNPAAILLYRSTVSL